VRLFCEAKNRAFRFNLLAMPNGFTLQSLARPRGFHWFCTEKIGAPWPIGSWPAALEYLSDLAIVNFKEKVWLLN
jgi:hypothetical protein